MSPHRTAAKRHTRWLLTVPLLGLLALWTGVFFLERLAPVEERDHLRLEVPPLATEEVTHCTRQAYETPAADIRQGFVATSRVSSTQIYACPVAYDRLRVTYIGEVVGEVLRRQGGAWAQVNDDAYALQVGPLIAHRDRHGFNTGIPVWLPDGLHEQVEGVGRPGRRGDVLVIEGVVFRADPHDGGGLTIRADEARVLAPHVEVDDPLHGPQAVTAAVLAALALVALAWSRRARHS